MTEPVFFLAAESLGSGERLVLDGAEGRHAADVRRIRVGETLVVTDGCGAAARCRVAVVRKAALDLDVEHRWAEAQPYPRLVVVQALAKGDRGETAVETLTEVGADVIVPWAASRSVTRWAPDRAEKAWSRWRAAAAEAAKQSRRLWWPDIRPLASTAEIAALAAGADLGLVLHEAAREPLSGVEVPDRPEAQVVVVVGPEGGISEAELETFVAAGARAVRLGPTVLRTSTAGTVAAAALLARTARWS